MWIDRLTDGDVIARIRGSLGFKETLQQEEARLEAERATAWATLEDLDRDYATQRPGFVAKRDKASEKVRAAEAGLRKAIMESFVAHRDFTTRTAQHRAAVQRVERVLRETAPAEIVETRRELSERMQRARGAFNVIDRLPQDTAFQNAKPVKEISNAPATTTICMAAIDGIRRCDALVTAPLSRAAILEELRRILASFPTDDPAFIIPVDLEAKPPMFTRVP
jgi:hypothetical protein